MPFSDKPNGIVARIHALATTSPGESLPAVLYTAPVPVTCSWLCESPPVDENSRSCKEAARSTVAWTRSAGAWCCEPACNFGLGVPRHHRLLLPLGEARTAH